MAAPNEENILNPFAPKRRNAKEMTPTAGAGARWTALRTVFLFGRVGHRTWERILDTSFNVAGGAAMSANQSKGPEKFSNLGRIYREVQELRQVRQAESVRGFEETPLSNAAPKNALELRNVSPRP